MKIVSRFTTQALAALAFSAISVAAQAIPLVVFGDSLSDNGNNRAVIQSGAGAAYAPTPASAITSNSYIPSIPYASGNYTNGDVWSDYLARRLGSVSGETPSVLGGTNFAYGGARTGGAINNGFPFPSNLVDQVNAYLLGRGGVADSTAIFVIAGGGNNARDTVDAAAPVALSGGNPNAIIASGAQANAAYILTMVNQLRAAGAQKIVVWDTPNLGATPAALASGAAGAGLATAISSAYNQYLTVALTGLPVTVFDVFGQLPVLAANSAFVNTTNACVFGSACTTGTNYLFYDGIHPSTTAHRLIADILYAQVPVPSVAFLLAIGLALMGFASRRRV